jgi:hypothetical protein
MTCILIFVYLCSSVLIGEGKLGSRNAIQFLLHDTSFSLYDEQNSFKGLSWNKMLRGIWCKVYGTEAGQRTITTAVYPYTQANDPENQVGSLIPEVLPLLELLCTGLLVGY